MKKLINRYSHWLSFFIIGISFISLLITFQMNTHYIIAVIFGGVGLLSIGYLTFIVEKKHKNKH